jgi:ribosomal-protein-serine acetyltransferase
MCRYWLSADAQGHGLMTRAVSTLCELAFESEALGCFDHVEICAAEKNLKSRAIPVRTMPAAPLQ